MTILWVFCTALGFFTGPIIPSAYAWANRYIEVMCQEKKRGCVCVLCIYGQSDLSVEYLQVYVHLFVIDENIDVKVVSNY